jgi:hypothetical protein
VIGTFGEIRKEKIVWTADDLLIARREDFFCSDNGTTAILDIKRILCAARLPSLLYLNADSQ